MATVPQTRVNASGDAFKSRIAAGGMRLVERQPLPPGRLGTQRRRPKAERPEGATRTSGASADAKRRSLDSLKELTATSDISAAQMLLQSLTPTDKHKQRMALQNKLEQSYIAIIRQLELHLDDLGDKETCPEVLKEIKLTKAKIARRQKDAMRIACCQGEWIGYKATCCRDAVAIPIGCNHRLCVLCNQKRSERYRERVRVLFDRLTIPMFLTLTVPNVKKLSKRTFGAMRKAWKKFRKINAGWMKGGIVALETTYNRKHFKSGAEQAPWHVHIHALIDSTFTLPRCDFRSPKGCRHRTDGTIGHAFDCAFIRFKRGLEFDWLISTGGRKAGWSNANRNQWFIEAAQRRDGAHDHEWNSANSRVVWIKPVRDRKKAAFEVLKYVTKASDFAHIPEAVDEFTTATRGTRMLQTFGTWYGFKFPEDVNKGMPSEKNNFQGLTCSCGKNEFERIGKLYREGVRMTADGVWRPKPELTCRGGPPG